MNQKPPALGDFSAFAKDSPQTPSADSFKSLLAESFSRQDNRAGSVIMAEVVRVERHFVVVSSGLKSESLIPIEEFKDDAGALAVAPGDFVSVAVESFENGYGDTILSRDKAKRLASWMALESALESGQPVMGLVTGKVKGGLSVQVNGIRAFLPGSQIDARPMREAPQIEGQTLEFKVIKLDRKRNNVVLSRRALMEASTSEARKKLAETLVEGSVVSGVVKNLTDYGAFVDLGGIDGLLHITDMAWRRVRHPSDMLAPGQQINAKILKYDAEKNRVSLGLKQLGSDPWEGLARRLPKGSRLFGKISNVADYGVFVEIEEGVEGLVHASEMEWSTKTPSPSKIAHAGQEVEVMVLEVDEARRRVSLGMKQCKPNPWEDFAANRRRGETVRGVIKSVTDFGVFVGVDGVDGLIHLADLSASEPGEEAMKKLKKGDSIEAVILSIDTERERVSLGVKQIGSAEFSKPARSAASERDEAPPATAFGNLLKSAVGPKR